jgi:hypothetical protein
VRIDPGTLERSGEKGGSRPNPGRKRAILAEVLFTNPKMKADQPYMWKSSVAVTQRQGTFTP